MNQIATLRPWQRRVRLVELRDIILAQLFHPRPDFKPDACREDLDALMRADPEGEKNPDYLEASILLTVFIGKRPRMAQKPLYRLYRHRLAQEEFPKFQQFTRVLEAAKAQGHSLEGLIIPQSFQEMDQDHVWTTVGQIMARVAEVAGPLFLNSGTLLGVVRDKGLIAHDDDVDLALVLDAGSAEEAARAWVRVYERLTEAGLIPERLGPNPGVYKLSTPDVFNIDLFPAWIAGGKVYVYPHTCGELDESDLLPLATCDTTGLLIPARPEAMLQVNYGDGWRAPDPAYSFPWALANRRFADFRSALDAAWAEPLQDAEATA